MIPSRSWIAPVTVAALAALVVAIVGGTITDLGPWYSSLKQPHWAPPRAAFGMIWTAIFALTALAAVAAWRRAPDQHAGDWMIGLFALNGFLNLLWSFLFFRMQRPDWAGIEVVVLWLSILGLVITCGRRSRAAGVLLLPYLAWVTIAAVLNWQVMALNGPFG